MFDKKFYLKLFFLSRIIQNVKSKIRNTYVGIAILAVAISTLFITPAAAVDTQVSLSAGEAYTEYFDYSNTTDTSEKEFRKTHLVIYKTPEAIDFVSDINCSVYLMNDAQLASYLTNGTIESNYAWTNTTEIQYAITFDRLTNELNLDYFEKTNSDGKTELIAYCYFVIVNEEYTINQFSLRVRYDNKLIAFLTDFFEHLLVFMFFAVSITLFVKAKKEKEAEEEIKAHILNNYGFGLFCGGIATLVWEIYHWYRELHPEDRWVGYFIFEFEPIENFSTNYLSFVSLIALGLAILFMSNTIEKDVQQKKIPYFTYFLVLMEGLLILGMFIPIILTWIMYIWIVSVALAGLNLLYSYIMVIRQVSGPVKTKTLKLVIGLFVTYLIVPMRVYIFPEFIPNMIASIFMMVMYEGLK